jgi:hypothetical protein
MRLFACFFFVTLQAFSQQWLGISSSNYAGTYSVYANPANIADSRYKFFLNIAGANAEVINNYASWAAPYSFIGLSTNNVSDKYRAANGLPAYKNTYTQEVIGKRNSAAFIAADGRGPSMYYTFEKAKLAIGLTSRVRFLTNLGNTSADVAHLMVSGTIIPDLFGQLQDNNHFTFNLNAYTELGFSLGAVIREQDQDFFKVGLTVKRLNSVMNIHYKVENVDFTVDRNAQRPTRQDLLFNNAQAIFGLTSTAALSNAQLTPEWVFGDLAAGTGYGFDIGAVYEYRPNFDKYDVKLKGKWLTDGTKNKYLYKIGVSLIDVGKINFNHAAYVSETKITATNTLVLPGTFNKVDSPDRLYNRMNNAFNLDDADYQHSFVSPLPTAFTINFDYKFSEKIYLNAVWLQSLRNPKNITAVQPSLLAVTPRFESKNLEVSLPIAIQNGYRNFTVGLMGRLGPLFIGTDNISGVFNIGNPKGISGYFGLFLPIHRKLPDAPNACYVEQKTTLRQELRTILHKRQQRKRWRGVK